MRGRIAAILLLLAVALLSDEDLHSTSRIPEIALSDAFRHAQHRVGGRRRSLWISGAWASPLLSLEQRLSHQEDEEIEGESSILTENVATDGPSSDSTDPRWRPFGNETKANGEVLGYSWSFPGGTKVPMGWADPRLRGGQMLDFTLPRLGEPLNVIISGLSDPYVLTPRGLLHYAQSLGFSSECLGMHLGQLHIANLGDSITYNPASSHIFNSATETEPYPDPYPHEGGNKTEQLLVRQNFDWPLYGWPDYGTCWESLVGGNHFRAWKQDGAGARTGAWFLAVSKELWLGAHHDISPNGYNGGRDALVARALKPTRWSPLQEGIWWQTDVTYNTSLLSPGKEGVNHGISQDGRVAILTVRRRPGQPTFSELHDAWGELATLPHSWDPDVRINSRRGRWELQIGGDDAPIQTMGSSNSRWRSVLTAIYRILTLPRA